MNIYEDSVAFVLIFVWSEIQIGIEINKVEWYLRDL